MERRPCCVCSVRPEGKAGFFCSVGCATFWAHENVDGRIFWCDVCEEWDRLHHDPDNCREEGAGHGPEAQEETDD